MKTRYLVDPSVYDLAEHFLQDVERATDMDKRELARRLQDVCEDYCEGLQAAE